MQTTALSEGPSFRVALLGFVASTTALATVMLLLGSV